MHIAHMLNDTRGCGKCLSGCTKRVLQQLKLFSLSKPGKRPKTFSTLGRGFFEEDEGGTRKLGFRGEFSDDREEEKGGCLEFWSTCFLND